MEGSGVLAAFHLDRTTAVAACAEEGRAKVCVARFGRSDIPLSRCASRSRTQEFRRNALSRYRYKAAAKSGRPIPLFVLAKLSRSRKVTPVERRKQGMVAVGDA